MDLIIPSCDRQCLDFKMSELYFRPDFFLFQANLRMSL